MTMQSKKQFKNQSQTEYMQNNQPQTMCGEAGKKNRIKTHSQSGRSMVEMLGVLAIIAILSIGGIVGFRLAMNYYQANQIAHEMNIMRTDAQIKIAQGTEKLILGEPYDPISESTLGHIQFNDDYPVDFACALADDETVELSNISCHVANAYYIELQNIPEGVCRPLAELVNGMNNIIAFNVNKDEYPETGKCEAGNGNVLNAVFSAEAVSELVACAEDTDCESESTHYCDPSRHVCVKCYEDNQCEHNQYCENNTCVTCESGVWNGEECVECTADDDCTDSDTPKCNTETNTCVECIESSNCSEEQVCRGNKCTTCQTEEECQAKGTTYHCSNASTCIQCFDNQVWDDESRECVECLSSADCKNSEKPQCNTDTNTCVECIESGDCEEALVCRGNKCTTCQTEEECQAKGTSYHCSNASICIQCFDNQVWDDESRECVECTADSDCTDTPNTPKCNTATNQCVECLNNQNCIEKDTNNPVCNSDTNTCEPCPPKSLWYVNDGKCHAYECRSNEDCADGEFCMMTLRYQLCEEFSPSPYSQTYSGKCVDVNSEKGYLPTSKFYYSEHVMTWGSAERFCKALHKPMATRSLLGCSTHSDSFCTESDIEEKIVQDLKSTGEFATVDPNGTQTHFWLEAIGECHAYHACYENKWIRYNSWKGEHTYIQALCKE